LPTGLFLWSKGSFSAGIFLTVILLSLGLTSPLIAAMFFVDDLAVVDTNVGEIASILDETELIRPKDESLLNRKEIQLKQVHFSYGKEEILHGINLEIKPETVTALVGPSGSGKSTIAKLIAGFWDVTSGMITLGGVDLHNISFKEWKKNYFAVTNHKRQQKSFYQFTVFYMIRGFSNGHRNN